jgi:hypothetical protein
MYTEDKGFAAFQAFLQGEFGQSETLFLEAIDELSDVRTENIFVALCIDGLAQLCRIQGRMAEAEQRYKESLTLFTGHFPEYEYGIFSNLCSQALITEDVGRTSEAESLYQQALSFGERALGRDHYLLVPTYLAPYEGFLQHLGRQSEASLIRDRIESIEEVNRSTTMKITGEEDGI